MQYSTSIPHVIESAQRYCTLIGLPPMFHPNSEQNATTATEIAVLYEALPVLDTRPEVQEAYAALVQEITAQWCHALADGYIFEAWNRPGQPYRNSAEMRADVREHHHLYFFRGGEPHPYMAEPLETGYNGNEMLRAVHDLYGHAAGGYSFAARGEENAWLAHSQMFTPLAQKAMTTETRGQNCWVNFGPYKHLPPVERPFAVQKVALLPDRYCTWQHLL